MSRERGVPIPIIFNYSGSKHQLARSYPAPRHSHIIEAFAGSAGYSCRYGADRDVTLIEKDDCVAGVWHWLIGASRADIRALPTMEQIPLAGVSALDIPQPARDLIGLSFVRAGSPRERPSRWAYAQGPASANFWSAALRDRIAQHIHLIKHWRILHGSYTDHPNVKATWFADPPYQEPRLAAMYRERQIDFGHLGEWARSRRGQTIVCETTKADWLPFRPLKVRYIRRARLGNARTDLPVEAIWTGTNP